MLVKLLPEDKVFESKPFIDEEVRFNLIHRIRDGAESLYTNSNGSIIIGQTSCNFPAWIYTVDNITSEDMEILKQDFNSLYVNASKLGIVAKPEVAIELAESYSKSRNIKYKVSMEMQSFECPLVIQPKKLEGKLDMASEDEEEIVGEFIAGFVYECFGRKIDDKEKKFAAKSYINNDKFYIWRYQGEIVAMANIAHESKRHARINEVYTRPDMRRKGYAAMLVAEISKIVHNRNKIPMLYTDMANPYSNKAYKNVGFMECGKLTQISFEIK